MRSGATPATRSTATHPTSRYFWEKVEGVKFRRKVRFRRYVGQADAFLEIKQRISHTVQKRPHPLAARPARGGVPARPVGTAPPTRSSPTRSPRELVLLWRTHDLRPCMATHYRRMALQGAYDAGLRVTFDTGVRYSGELLNVAEGFEGGHEIVDPRLSIMEVKFNERAPEWLSDMILGVRTQSHAHVEEYCRGVDLHLFDGQFT